MHTHSDATTELNRMAEWLNSDEDGDGDSDGDSNDH